MDRRPYAVIAFTGEEQEEKGEIIAIVPVKWIDKPNDEITDMFWPPKNWPERGSRLVHLKRAVQNCIEPDIHWLLLKGTVLHLYSEYDDAIRGLKKAEDDTSLETEVDGAPRKRKPPKRYLDFYEDSENEEINMPLKKKGFQKLKVRRLNESTTDESDNTTLPRVNSDILNEVRSIHVSQIANKEREKMSRNQPVESHARIKVLQQFQDNSSQDYGPKQLKKVCNSLRKSNINKKHGKQHKIDHIKQKLLSNKTKQKKRHAVKNFNSETSSVLSPIKDKVISSKTSEVSTISSLKSSISALDFPLSDVPQTIKFSFPPSMQINSLDGKESSCSSPNPSLVHSTFDKVGEEETKSQVEPYNSLNLKDKGNCGCKYCHNEIKLSSIILLEISKKLDSVLINQAIIVRSVNPDYAKSMIPSNIPSIPLKTKEDF